MSKLARLRRVPWLLVFEAARLTHGHIMDATSPADRRRVMQLVRRTKGNPRALTDGERAELKAIAGKIELKQLATSLGPSLLAGRHRHR